MLKIMLKEPLLQFMVLGALIFLLNYLLNGDARPSGNQATSIKTNSIQSNSIEISPNDIERFVYLWQKTHFRAPSRLELNNLIESRIKEEVLSREALLLGLDQGDAVIRQRLAHKLTFLSEGFSEQGTPTAQQIKSFYKQNKRLFMTSVTVSFQQVFLDSQNRNRSNAQIESLLTQLAERENDPGFDLRKAGDPSLLLSSYQDKDQKTISQIFGQNFSHQLINAPTDNWLGPIASSYGSHLVKIVNKTPPQSPELAQVKQAVIDTYLEQRREQAEQTYYDNLRANYRITIADLSGSASHNAATK